MKKILLLIIPVLLMSCINDKICFDTPDSAYNAICKAVSTGDFETLKKISTDHGFESLNEVLKNYKWPTISLKEEEPDGAFGIKERELGLLYYTSFKEVGIENEIKVIDLRKIDGCYKLISVATVVSTKKDKEVEEIPKAKVYGQITSIADGFDVKNVNLWSSTDSNRRVVGSCVNNEKVEIGHHSDGYVYVTKSNGISGYCLADFLK